MGRLIRAKRAVFKRKAAFGPAAQAVQIIGTKPVDLTFSAGNANGKEWPWQASAKPANIRHSSSDTIPNPLALDPFALFSLTSAVLQASMSSTWLSLAGSLVARMAREQNDRQASDADVARLAAVAENVLTSVLRQLQDVAGTNGRSRLEMIFEIELTCSLASQQWRRTRTSFKRFWVSACR